MSEEAARAPESDFERSIDELARSMEQSLRAAGEVRLPEPVIVCAKLILSGLREAILDSQITDVPQKVVEQAQELGRILRKDNYQLRDVFQASVWLRRSARRMLLDDKAFSGRDGEQLRGRVDRWFDDLVFAAANAYHEAQRAELQKRIVIDGLTGVFNRTYFGERLAEEIERGRRYSHPVTLLMIDLDSLKPINDRFGHRAGDAVIKSLSQVLRAQSRSVDVVTRYGGDEFMVIMPQTGPEGGWALAERIGRALRESQSEELRDLVSVSVGIASFPRDADTAEGLVDAADQALYRSKSQGGNTVAAFGSKVVADMGCRLGSTEGRGSTPNSRQPHQKQPDEAVKVWMDRVRQLERQNLELNVSLGLAKKKVNLYEKLEASLQEILGDTLRAAAETGILGDVDGELAAELERQRQQLAQELARLRSELQAVKSTLTRERSEAERNLAEIRAEAERLVAEEREAEVRRVELMEEIAALEKQRDLARAQIEAVLKQISDLSSGLESCTC